MKQSRLRLIGLTLMLSVLAACGGGDSEAQADTDQVSLPGPQAALVEFSNCDAAALTAGTFQFVNGSCVRSTNAFQSIPSRLAAQPFAAADLTLTTDALLDWAETQYSQFFAPAAQPTAFLAPYSYRYYPATQNYLGIAGEDIYVLGPLTGNLLTRVGSFSDFQCRVLPQTCPAPGAPSIQSIAALDSGANVLFVPPSSDGGTPIKQYAAVCTSGAERVESASVSSPITVGSMRNGITYSCVVTATNSFATGVASAPMLVKPAGLPSVGAVEGIWRESEGFLARYLLVESNGQAWGFSGELLGYASKNGHTGALRGLFRSTLPSASILPPAGTVSGTWEDVVSFSDCSSADPNADLCAVSGLATSTSLTLAGLRPLFNFEGQLWDFSGVREAGYATPATLAQVTGSWTINGRYSINLGNLAVLTVDSAGVVNAPTSFSGCAFSGKLSPVPGKGYFRLSAASVIGNCPFPDHEGEIEGVAFVTQQPGTGPSFHFMWRTPDDQYFFWASGRRP